MCVGGGGGGGGGVDCGSGVVGRAGSVPFLLGSWGGGGGGGERFKLPQRAWGLRKSNRG